ALRVFRVLRLIRAARTLRALLGIMFESRMRGSVISVATLTFLLLSISSIAMLLAERGMGGQIDTAEDALWWSIATVTTVGYGDVYPITAVGRSVASVLMIAGVGLFGTLSGTVAGVFLGAPKVEDDERVEPPDPARLREEILALRLEVAALRTELAMRETTREVGPREPAE
ncbi:MAG: two pore domain potassium channel family protein, partial [Polyangiaceae bacterium]|nr:two pore domain potassium channel family protein [Polyangiaceae bacterium]